MADPPPLPACVPSKPQPFRRDSGRLATSVLERFWFGDEDPIRTAQEASASFAAALGTSLRLRAFPGVAARALELLSRPEVDSRDVSGVLERDPAVSAHIMALANSAAFGGLTRCSSVKEAVARLGNRHTAELVLSVAALGMYEDASGVPTLFRDHAVGVATIARCIADSWGGDTPDTVFAVALFSDLGKLFMLAARDVDYDAVAPHLLETPDKIHVVERMWVGWDHAVLGAHLLAAWNLPEELSLGVAWHHQPGRAYAEGGDVALSVAFLRIADSVEYQLRKNPEADPRHIEELARSGDASYAGLSARNLSDLWPRFASVRASALLDVARVARRRG